MSSGGLESRWEVGKQASDEPTRPKKPQSNADIIHRRGKRLNFLYNTERFTFKAKQEIA